jgi:TPR repeat protein
MDKPIEQLTMLANKGDAQAQYELGIIQIAEADTYWLGMEWLRKAADHGHKEAQDAFDEILTDDDGRFDAWA